jgi:uncharacterized phiE125 gp8 family phage protein
MDVYRPLLVTAPTVDAVTIEQAKKQCEIAESDTAHDEHLYQLIDRARDEFEADCDLCISPQTWRVYTDHIKDGMQLQKGPIQSITSIKYYDSGNTLQTLATSVYGFDVANRKIRLKYDQVWPAYATRWDAWEITYICGFTTLPPMAVQAMLILIEKYFLGREALKEPEFKTYQRLVNKMQRSTYP